MIDNPYRQKEIRFYDWDDCLIGVLSLPDVGADMREFVNFFVEQNFIHPDLRVKNYIDHWAEERKTRRENAEKRWKNRRIYPVEMWKFTTVDGELHLQHSLRFQALTGRKGETK